MADACELRIKRSKGRTYYKCIPRECHEACLLYVIWHFVKRKGLSGREFDYEYVDEVGCECVKFDDWWGRPINPGPCITDMAMQEFEKDGKTYHKNYIRCVPNSCTKECVFSIQFNDPEKEGGEFTHVGCDCVEWTTL